MKGAIEKSSPTTSRIFKPNNSARIKWVLIGILFTFFGGMAFLSNLASLLGLNNRESGLGTLIGTLVFVALGLFAFHIARRMARHSLPRLTLSATGIEFESNLFAGAQCWKWPDCGVFYYRTQSTGKSRVHLLCAWFDIKHDVMIDADPTIAPTIYDCDIRIDISELVGLAGNGAKEMVEVINEWREKFGNPEDNSMDVFEQERNEINVNTLATRKKYRLLFLLVGILGAILYGWARVA